MDLGLRGKVAVVTGASAGLGRACAEALAGEGMRAIICARRRELLEDVARPYPDQLWPVAADLRSEDTPARLLAEARARFGGIDVLVVNAGGPPPATALEIAPQALRDAFELNMLAAVRLVTQAVGPMRERGWGRICLVASVAVKQPIAHLAASNSARAALWAWAKTAAGDLFSSGVTLNVICPGSHATARYESLNGPLRDKTDEQRRRVGRPEDFGKVVAFLCSEHARFISGTTVVVDGAATVGL